MGRTQRGLPMKKIALMLVAAATLAASMSPPAEARSVRVVRPATAAVAAATAAAIAADYYYGGYYYAPGVVYYGGPGYYGYPAVRYGWGWPLMGPGSLAPALIRLGRVFPPPPGRSKKSIEGVPRGLSLPLSP